MTLTEEIKRLDPKLMTDEEARLLNEKLKERSRLIISRTVGIRMALYEQKQSIKLRKEAENGKQLKKPTKKSGKTRDSDFSFSTEHESKQTA